MSAGGFVQKRRGVLDHLRDGRLTLAEYGAYDAIILSADKATGIWWGSPRALAATCGAGDISERQARHILETLERKGYLKRFATRRSRRNYPVIIDKFQPSSGAYKGLRLNAAATSDWRRPVYEQLPTEGLQHGAQHGVENAANGRRLKGSKSFREREREGAPESGALAAQAERQPSPFTFAGLHVQITERQDRALGEAFPWVNRAAEYCKADSWVESNPSRRPRNCSRFLHNWFSKIPAPSNGAKGGGRGTIGDTVHNFANA